MDNEKTMTNPAPETLLLFWNSVRRSVYDLDVEDSKLTEDHENRIRRHYDQLLSNINVPDVVTQMFQNGKLTKIEHEHLRQFHSTPIRASEELLNIIIVKSRDVYECFLESLKKTKQHHVYQMLTSDVGIIGEQSVSEHSRLIRQNYVWLTEKLDPDSGLLQTLYANEVLSKREYGQIFVERDEFVKNEMLLTTISRKSVEDFTKFIVVLNDTKQGHIAKRLTETPLGDANQNVTTTVIKTLPTVCTDTFEKAIPPKPPPRSKKQPPTLSSSIKPKPILKPEIHLSKPNRIEKRPNVAFRNIMRKRSVQYLQEKFRGLPNELQTEVSTKVVQLHQRKPTDSTWKITLTKMLEESRNIKGQKLVQAKINDENCERLKQEIVKRERECKIIKEDIQLEKTNPQKQLRELQETVYELEYRHIIAKNENRNMSAKLKKTEFEVEGLKMLNKQKEQEANEEISIIKKLEDQVRYSEIKLKETEAQLRYTHNKLTESDRASKETTRQLKEAKDRLKETKTKLTELEAKLIVTEKETELRSKDSRGRCLDLEEKLRLERTEKDHLREKIQEYREIIDELQDRYKSDPVFVHSITTKFGKKNLGLRKLFRFERRRQSSANDELMALRGMTILDKELFIVNDDCSKVEVYDSMIFSFSRRLKLKKLGLIVVTELVPCNINKCLYIFHCIEGNEDGDVLLSEILRIDPNGNLIRDWSTGDAFGRLSVSVESNVILAVHNKNKLNEYSSDGQLIREINLSSDTGICHLLHAIKMPNGHFVVSHGEEDDDLHRVCIVDSDGNLRKSFGGKCGSTTEQMNNPVYLSVDVNGFVMVVDCYNSRVLLLNKDLEFKREILSKEKHGLQNPTSILYDDSNGRLFVADSEWNTDGGILIFHVNK